MHSSMAFKEPKHIAGGNRSMNCFVVACVSQNECALLFAKQGRPFREICNEKIGSDSNDYSADVS